MDSHDDEIEELEQPIKRGPGRPKGSSSKKAPESMLTIEKLRQIYQRTRPIMTKEQREYTEKIIRGEIDVDPMIEMKLLVHMMSMVFAEASVYHLAESRATRDYASFANNLRMAIESMYDMMEKEEKKAEKAQSTDDVLRFTEKRTSMDWFDKLLSSHSDEGEEGTGS